MKTHKHIGAFASFTRKQKPVRSWEKYTHESDTAHTNTAEHSARTLTDTVRAQCEDGYISPTDEHLSDAAGDIHTLLASGLVSVSIPMKEEQPSVTAFLKVAGPRMPDQRIIIIDDGSTENVVAEVLKHRVATLVPKSEILATINEAKLLPILGLDHMPRGKGVAVFASYLLHYLAHTYSKNFHPQWIIHTDADIGAHKSFRPLDYLSYGMLAGNDIAHVKLAQSGRNNEATMAIRSMLGALGMFTKDATSAEMQGFSARASDLFAKLAKYKWILSGTFALSFSAAMRRPFATGYIEETLIAAYVEDAALRTVQVANENRCTDGANDFMKESIIVQQAANFTACLSYINKNVHEWTIDDIANINSCILKRPVPLAFIPPTGPEPVIGYAIENERIIPSIEALAGNGFIDMEKGKQLVKKYFS